MKKVFCRNKSQVALENIATYGFAMLIVLAVIASLFYLGMLNPSIFLSNECTLQSGLFCVDSKATGTSLIVNIKNIGGYDISIDKIEADHCTPLINNGKLSDGIAATYTLNCINGGTKYDEELNITYTNMDTLIVHLNQGSVKAKIEG